METKREVIFAFLDDLRDSGKINMFGAAPYVEEVFGLERREARKVVIDWMESFNDRKLLH